MVAYLVAAAAMLFAASAALTLIRFVSHLDVPAPAVPTESSRVEPAAAA